VKKISVLIIEDDLIHLNLILHWLKKSEFDFDYRHVQNENDYIEALNTFMPDIILSDYYLPDFNGLRALEIFKSRNLSIPFIVVTGEIGDEKSVEIIKKGADDYVLKDRLVSLPEVVKRNLKSYEEKNKILLMQEEISILARFPEDNPNPVFRSDINGIILYANKASEKIFAEWNTEVGKNIPAFLMRIIQRASAESRKETVETYIENKIYVFIVNPITENNTVYFYGLDVSELKFAQEELKLFSKIFNSTNEGILIANADQYIESINPAFTGITGYSREEALGQKPSILKSDKHEISFYDKMWEEINEKNEWSGEIWNRRKNGEIYPQWLSISVFKDDKNNVKFYIGIFKDISELKEKDQELKFVEFYDPLTTLPNRKLFSERLDFVLKKAHRENHLVSVLFIDVDHFKVINDTMGFVYGDDALKEIAARLQLCIREDDLAARFGGDLFVLFLSELTKVNEVIIICERIMKSFKEPVLVNDQEVFFTFSIGISVYPNDATTLFDMVTCADSAMNFIKNLGGNQYQFYSQEMNDRVKKRLLLENNLRKAIIENQLILYYQPIVNIKSSTIIGVEALIRWQHPVLGMITPGEFIPLAEETGIIFEIDRWALREALTQNKKWQTMGFAPIYVSVNLTAHQFRDNTLIGYVNDLIAEIDISPECLVLEITEGSIMQNTEEIIAIMKEIRKTGVKFSIDDFGTGYSSLSYLKKFPLDNLKIDKSFVVDLPYDTESVVIAHAIINIARGLKLKIISEGVEDKDQLDFFTDNNGDNIQGYYFSPPVPPSIMEKYFREQKKLH